MSQLVTVVDAAEQLRVSRWWVRRHASELGVVRLGRMVRLDSRVLEEATKVRFGPGKSLRRETEVSMLRRYQRGAVYLYKGKRVKTWYGVYRADHISKEGELVRRQRNVRLGTISEIPTRAAARERLRLLMGSQTEPRLEMTYAELVEKFVELRAPALKGSTRRYRLRMLKSAALARFNPVLASQVSRAAVEALVIEQAQRYSDSVVRGLLSSLSQLFEWAVGHGWLERNPCQGVDVPHTCGGKRVERYLMSAEQVSTIVRQLPEPYATLVLLLATTGLRIGEAIALRHEDLTDGVLCVRRRILDREVDTVKSRRSNRVLPIPEALLHRLRSLSQGGWLFQARNGEPMDAKNAMNRWVKPAALAAGLRGLNWHSFRHSFQVSQRRAGTHPKLVSSLLGHASVATAMDSYDHAAEAELRQPLDQLLRSVMKFEPKAAEVVDFGCPPGIRTPIC